MVTLVVRAGRSGGGQRDYLAGSPAVTVIWGDYDLPLQLVARHTMEISIRRRAADIAGQYRLLLIFWPPHNTDDFDFGVDAVFTSVLRWLRKCCNGIH